MDGRTGGWLCARYTRQINMLMFLTALASFCIIDDVEQCHSIGLHRVGNLAELLVAHSSQCIAAPADIVDDLLCGCFVVTTCMANSNQSDMMMMIRSHFDTHMAFFDTSLRLQAGRTMLSRTIGG